MSPTSIAAETQAFALLPSFDPELGEIVLEPEGAGPGHWVGAPSVTVDPATGRVLLAYRRRSPRDGATGERGYFAAVAESSDGVNFTDVWTVTKDELRTRSIERLNLRADTANGGWLLYLSYEDPVDDHWRIDVIRAAELADLRLDDMTEVLTAATTGVDAVKDPYVVRVGPAWYMFISTFITPGGHGGGPAPTSLAVSMDGVRWSWLGETFAVGAPGAWDSYQARINSVLRTDAGFLGFYDGAASYDEDTEERCGIAFSADLRSWQRLTVEGPWLTSPHGRGSLRYVDAIPLGDEILVYYEYTREDGAHDLRLARLPRR